MMKKLFCKLLLNWMLRQIDNEEFKAKVIDYINMKVDVPAMDEEQEKKFFEQVYVAMQGAVSAWLLTLAR